MNIFNNKTKVELVVSPEFGAKLCKTGAWMEVKENKTPKGAK